MSAVWHGPAAWEGAAPRRYGPVARVAVVSDVHANVPALTAVLADIGVSTGDPAAEKIEGLLLSPPSPGQSMAKAEQLVFSD